MFHAAVVAPEEFTNRPPVISPDYRDTMIPPNIAPLNFYVQEPGRAYRVRFRGRQGAAFEINSRRPLADIPPQPWRELLSAQRGQLIYFDVSVQRTNGAWLHFAAITNFVAPETIDAYLVYRLLNWQFSMYGSGTIGIYQRHLEDFEEINLLKARDFLQEDVCCMNCHTFIQNQPETMALHVRSEQRGKPMLLGQAGQVTTINQPAGLLAWHPSGRLLITGVNKFSMLFHAIGRNRDVFDSAGDLNVYHVADQRYERVPKIATTNHWETWPTWSPDGQYLYYCRTPISSQDRYQEVKYDLLRIPYNLASNTWGEAETILAAKQTSLSIAQPRISPNGRWLLFCMFPYSSFPWTQPGSDLYLMNLADRSVRKLEEINSEHSESWHSWSLNSRWVVFSSKRRDGLLTRPHIAYLDANGRAGKPFILPQKDPAYYDSLLKMYNLPELVTGPVEFSKRNLYEAIYRPKYLVKPAGLEQVSAPTPAGRDYSPLPGSNQKRGVTEH